MDRPRPSVRLDLRLVLMSGMSIDRPVYIYEIEDLAQRP